MGSNIVSRKQSLKNHAICQGRLSLESGAPISNSNQTAKGTLYFVPYKGNLITVFDGNRWDVSTFSELSLSLSGYTASKPYDIWIYNNAGTLTLESTIWTNGTTRATALTTQDGIYVKTGATTRRYLGTIYINSSGAQCEDTITQRFVWNYYNRVIKGLYKPDGNAHQYGTNTWRPWNNDTGVKIEVILGVSEDALDLGMQAELDCIGDDDSPQAGIGIDITNNSSKGIISTSTDQLIGAGYYASAYYLAEGYHYFAGVEKEGTGNNANFQVYRIWSGGLF